ncbi:MAG: major facilitator family transporter [Bacillales bacterium]|nr:major facilitator family transporter [Bacillales bacterium]
MITRFEFEAGSRFFYELIYLEFLKEVPFMRYDIRRLGILIFIVFISGVSQGMLMPLISIILEQSGVSSTANGLHATGIYLGILVSSPFMEAPLRKIGYQRILQIGGLMTIGSLLLFPVWKSVVFWFVLRLVVGVGDHMLHFATQTWITDFTPSEKRGRTLSLYGLSFSIGFAIGPLLAALVKINMVLPFVLSSIMCGISWVLLFFLRNERPFHANESTSFFDTARRFRSVIKIAWLAFISTFIFGYLESSMNVNFPVFGLRTGLSINEVSTILPAFSFGAIITLFPLGFLSDRYGRRKVLTYVMFGGALSFLGAALSQHSVMMLFITTLCAGMIVGSTFSLGISFMADLLPKDLLPAGNLLCGIFYSFGSISGPFVGGAAIEYISSASFFYCIFGLLRIWKYTFNKNPTHTVSLQTTI